MAAYSAVISLLQTLEQRTPELMIRDRTLESIHATAQYFHDVLEDSRHKTFDHEKIKSLEEKIRVAASEAQDVIELKFCQFIKVPRWTCGILQHLDLLPVVEKLDTTKKQVMDILSHILEFSGDSLIGTSSTSYPMLSHQLEDDIAHGIDDDLEIIVKRLTGPPSDLDIVTITGMGGIGKTTLARKAYHHLPIRVLVIFNEDVMFKSFPLVINKLFHLRYLQVRSHGNIPESISELQNLQTLMCGSFSSIVKLPGKIWMMKNLRYIRLEGDAYLPSSRRESLVTGMPNLEELSGLCYTSCTDEVFSGIPNIKRLIIQAPFNKEKFPNWLLDMSRLTKLEAFKFYASPLLADSIKRYIFPTSLRRLSLTGCRYFDWEDISSSFIMLPNLEEFKLKSSEPMRGEWILSDKDEFKSLKLLLLSGAYLKRWEASSNNFPNLKHLVLKNLWYLREIPADFGEICTLESIELHDCSDTAEDSAREIEQEQEDMGNNSLKVYIHNNCSN